MKPSLVITAVTWIVGLGILSGSAWAEDAPQPFMLVTEAEALVPPYGSTGFVVNPAPASGGHKVFLHHQQLVWEVQLPRSDRYFVWFRARSGYSQDRYYTTKPESTYQLRLGKRRVHVSAQTQTLVWHSDETNYVWWRSEPLNLDKGDFRLALGSAWDGAHVDKLLITSNEQFIPGPEDDESSAVQSKSMPIQVWVGDPLAKMTPQMSPAPDETDSRITLGLMRGATGYGGVYVHNTDKAQINHIGMHLTAMQGPAGQLLDRQSIRILKLAYTGIQAGQLAGDALVQVNRLGAFDVAPNSTMLFWVYVDVPRDQMPGEYTGQLTIKDQKTMAKQEVPITVIVSPLELPDTDDLTVFNWGGYYALWYDGWHSSQAYWNDQLAHGTDTFRIYVSQNIDYEFDSEGSLVGEMDFSRLAKHVHYVKQTGGHLLLQWNLTPGQPNGLQSTVHKKPRGAALLFMSLSWQRAFQTLVVHTTDYLVGQGINPAKILQYPYDEYMGEDFIRVAQLIRRCDPDLKIFADLSASLETYRSAAPYVDIWCPPFSQLENMDRDGRLAFLRSTGKPIWFYEASHVQRQWSPYSKFRLKFWLAYQYDLQGCTFWKYLASNVGTAYLPMDIEFDGGPVTSRRWEAWWSGCQDYRILKMVQAACLGNAQDRERLKRLVKNVLADPSDTRRAQTARTELVHWLADVQNQ